MEYRKKEELISKEVLSKFKIKIVSINTLDITDDIYFSKAYSGYISNSSLNLLIRMRKGLLKPILKD